MAYSQKQVRIRGTKGARQCQARKRLKNQGLVGQEAAALCASALQYPDSLSALVCGAAGTALGAPNEPGQLHVEGQLLPVDGSPGIYRVTGGLVGTYKLRSERVINCLDLLDYADRDIEGTESITGCVDQNQNQSCDAGRAVR